MATSAPAQRLRIAEGSGLSPFPVRDQIKDLDTRLGGAGATSGFPGLGAQPYGVDGLRQTFTGGAIIWTPATGAAPTSNSPAAAARAGNGHPDQK